jgi:hypothetical protein
LWRKDFFGKKWVIGATYQQFIPEDQRDDLPPVLIAGFDTGEEFKRILLKHSLPEKLLPLWLNLFQD